jgi:excinuclease ABC subunit A
VTGVSGSGKSSLAFDTLYAEGQRRYVASLSSYARQFLERLPRPEVESISHLPPAIAIEPRNRVTNARSTVGTATEILDYLRLLYAHAGETWCPACRRRVEPGGVEAVAGRIGARFAGERVSLGAPLPREKSLAAGVLRERLLREGYTRLLDADGSVRDAGELGARDFDALRSRGWLLVDRLALRGGADEPRRLAEAVASAFERGSGRLAVVTPEGVVAEYQSGLACDGCGRRFPAPTPLLFSFNSPLGACEACQGFGRIPGLDRERVVPDPGRSLAEGAVAPFATPSGARYQARLLAACARAGIPVDVPVAELRPEQLDLVFRGDGQRYKGVDGYFARLERKRYKVQNRVLIARYRRFDPCPECAGARLRQDALCVRVGGLHLAELCAMTLGALRGWLESLDLPAARSQRVARLLADLRARVAAAVAVGLDYVTLDRTTRTLSGGEAQRIQLASALGGTLTASLYVLDEPSIGLHARDLDRLIGILERIRDQGNTVVVVEHAPEVIRAADHVVDLGPGAGRLGGRVVAEGDVAALRADPRSLTGRALAGALDPLPRTPRPASGRLRIVGAREHNLRDVDVDVPLGQLVVVSGVSGAGKSTLVRSVLVGHLRRDPERGACTRIEGGEALDEVVVVDAAPPARSPRSNPATVSKAFEPIRRRFAETREARAKGWAPGWFSFNVPGGRCEACEGAGEVVVDMQFLDDVRMPCDVCDGRRYKPEVLELRLRGRSIVDVLDLTVDEALEFFADDAQVRTRLEPLQRVGLGYVTLGQPLSTLSGGEAQRLRVAQALHEGAARTLYVLDEPTTGLHPADIRVLLGCLDALLAAGASVIVVEHNLDVIRRADWVIDMGPEGGPGGGRVVAEGPPEAIASADASHTGAALREHR